jgi:hypothetical protein
LSLPLLTRLRLSQPTCHALRTSVFTPHAKMKSE